MNVKWSGIIGLEGTATGDGRIIESGALEWELPIPLRYVEEDNGGHDGAYSIGRVLDIERNAEGEIVAYGDIDVSLQHASEAVDLITRGIQDGVSMDLDNVSFEIRVAAEVLDEVFDEEELKQQNDDGTVTVHTHTSDAEMMVTTGARIRAVSIVSIPAFIQAKVKIEEEAVDIVDADLSLVASARKEPLRDYFGDPMLEQPTPLTVTDDGRVYGHLAVWGTCHIGFAGDCVQPPSSPSGYEFFHVATLKLADGERIGVGKITVDTKHAGPKLSAVSALTHYEDTGATAAFVRAGEDAHGIWVAGVVSEDATDKQVRALATSPLSGDWRAIGGNLELVGALSVNLPGFPVPRTAGLVASGGEMMTLVASGVLVPGSEEEDKSKNDEAGMKLANRVKLTKFAVARKGWTQ